MAPDAEESRFSDVAWAASGGPRWRLLARTRSYPVPQNAVSSNKGPGLDLRRPMVHGGDRVRVEANTFKANCAEEPEPAARTEIRIPAGVADIHIGGNAIDPAGGSALRVERGARRVSCYSNTVGTREQTAADVTGDAAVVSFTAPDPMPPVGPAALPLDGARHLGLATLPAWRD